jgi:predicted DNA-binding transcriptional regulator YafY
MQNVRRLVMRADRLLSLMLLLQNRGKMLTATLARELGVSRRTILRDIDALSGAGVPIWAEGGHGGGVALDEQYRTSLTGLNEPEIRALFLGGNSSISGDLGLADAAASGRRKLDAALPQSLQPAVEFFRQRVLVDPDWWWHEAQPRQILTSLQDAVLSDRPVSTRYESWDGKIAERVLEPYGLVAKSSFWYLVARREAGFRTYRVSRFHTVEVLTGKFQRDLDFDLEAYWQEHLDQFMASFSDYTCILEVPETRLKFLTSLAPGRCQALGPGSMAGWIRVRIGIDSRELACMLVFGLGTEVLILEPADLAQAVSQAAAKVLAQHRG